MPLTYVRVPGSGLWIPAVPPWQFGSPGFTSGSALTSTSHAQHYICQVPKTGTLKGFGCRILSVTTPNTVRCGFQNVDATNGRGDGSFDEYVDVASGSLPTGWFDTSTIGPITNDGTGGGTKRSVTAGDLIAAVLVPTATAVELRHQFTALEYWAGPGGNFPYAVDTVTGAKHDLSPFALLYDDDTWGEVLYPPVDAFNSATFNSTDSPDERALRFSLPFNYTIRGFYFKTNISNDLDFVLYDSDGTTALATISADKDIYRDGGFGYYTMRLFTSSIALAADTFYRIAQKPGGSNVTYYDFDVPSAALMDTQDGGSDFHESHRTDAGSWTNVTTRRPWAGIIIDQIETGVSMGGSTEHSHASFGVLG